MEKLSAEEIEKHLTKISGWKYENNSIVKHFTFKNFSENFAFMTRLAMLAETLNHHPDWSGGYKNLTIQLSTHDAGGVSEKDFEFAEGVEKVLQKK